jgi:hypothetical protein
MALWPRRYDTFCLRRLHAPQWGEMLLDGYKLLFGKDFC